MDGCERREAEKELEVQQEIKKKKKKKKCERNRTGRSNYLVVKWPKCRVFLILNDREGVARILYNKLN